MKNPLEKKGRKLLSFNPKPTKAQLLAEPVTHRLYFKADQDFQNGRAACQRHPHPPQAQSASLYTARVCVRL